METRAELVSVPVYGQGHYIKIFSFKMGTLEDYREIIVAISKDLLSGW